MSWRRLLSYSGLVLVALYLVASGFRVYTRKYYLFLADYVQWSLRVVPPPAGLTHVFFLFTDHFEPDYDGERTERWAARYTALAARHRDSAGRPPQHTWFYPGEQSDPLILEVLRRLTAEGLGEVELHYHHDYDTAETLRPKLREAIEDFQRYGFLKTIDGETRFAFIHGNFGLDNANGPEMCGVNTELRMLHEIGCFADFSFPSVYLDSQPPFVNRLYAAKDDEAAKSYRHALPLTARDADLMIFQGPLVFAPTRNIRRLFLDVDDGNIHETMPSSPERVDRWLRANIHVPGRPEWVFVKVFAHGVSSRADEEEVVGPHFDETLTYLERRYNDGTRFALHYITAREAFNLALAAANGAAGDPQPYLDRYVPPYVAGHMCRVRTSHRRSDKPSHRRPDTGARSSRPDHRTDPA